jgi:hypothetical protein
MTGYCRLKYIGSLSFTFPGNGKRQVQIFFAKFSLNVSYFLFCVERIIMHCSFKTTSSFTVLFIASLALYRKLFFAWSLPFDDKREA